MNPTAFYKLLLLPILLASLDILYAELLKPTEGGEEKEILIVSGKRRLYYNVRPEGLMYAVQGPVRLKFITRYPAMTPGKKARHKFSYDIILNEADTIQVRHKYLRQKSIRSIQHPNHHYTYSGQYTINIPDGQHRVRVLTPENQKYPVLLRAVSKTFELEYFELKNDTPLQIVLKGPNTLRITSRLAFEDWMGDEEAYRLQLREGNDIIGTYFFNTERSNSSSFESDDSIVPSKWRTCEVRLSEGDHIVTVTLLENDRRAFLRFVEFK